MIIVLWIGLVFDLLGLSFILIFPIQDYAMQFSLVASTILTACLILTVINQSTKIEKLQKYLHLNKDSEPETEEDKANDQNKK